MMMVQEMPLTWQQWLWCGDNDTVNALKMVVMVLVERLVGGNVVEGKETLMVVVGWG